MPRSTAAMPALSAPMTSLPPVSRALVAVAMTLAAWEERRISRRALARLDSHMLRDVGLSVQSRADETAKPFWRE